MFTKNIVKTLIITSTLVGMPALAADNNSGLGTPSTQVKLGEKCAIKGNCHKGFNLSRRLNLTDDQLLKISTLKDQYRIGVVAKGAECRALNDQIKNVLTKPQLDKPEAVALQNKLNGLRDQISNDKLQFRMDFMSVLTPDQKEKVRHHMLVSELGGGHRMEHRFGGRFEGRRA